MHVKPLVPTLAALDLTHATQPLLHWARVLASHAATVAGRRGEADASERCTAAEQRAARRLRELAALQGPAPNGAENRTPVTESWLRLADVMLLQPGSKCSVVGVVDTAQGSGGVVAKTTKSGRTAWMVDLTDPGCPGVGLRVAFEAPPKQKGACGQAGGQAGGQQVCNPFHHRQLIPFLLSGGGRGKCVGVAQQRAAGGVQGGQGRGGLGARWKSGRGPAAGDEECCLWLMRIAGFFLLVAKGMGLALHGSVMCVQVIAS